MTRRLRRPLIEYGTIDTCGSIGYTLIEDGEVVEDFFAEDDESRPVPEKSWFTSTRRDVRLDRIENIYDFVSQFFIEQDAFDPGIEFDYFFDYDPPEKGEHGTVINPGFVTASPKGEVRNTPGIERVDYLALKTKEQSRVRRPEREIPLERPESGEARRVKF